MGGIRLLGHLGHEMAPRQWKSPGMIEEFLGLGFREEGEGASERARFQTPLGTPR